MASKILIVGAGPAGASLAIRLARKGFPVVLTEKTLFPRHKLCGEFISPECLSHFKDLDVLHEMETAGGDRVFETRFFSPGGRPVTVRSSVFDGGRAPALSLSRSEMDFRLLERAKAAGVKVLEQTTAIDLVRNKDQVTSVLFRGSQSERFEISADFFVDATGRGSLLSRLFEKKDGVNDGFSAKQKFVGFKNHFRDVDLKSGVCEIYFFNGGYGGLSRIENGFANLCFLITAETAKNFGGKAPDLVDHLIRTNKRAAETLKDAVPAREWLAVAVDSFGMRSPVTGRNLFSIGDSAAFLDPFTGSGMLMALESAGILADCFDSTDADSTDVAQHYLTQYKRKFTRRLRMCSLLRRAAFVPALAALTIATLGTRKSVVDFLARATRS